MPPSNRRGKDASKPKGKGNPKPKSTSKTPKRNVNQWTASNFNSETGKPLLEAKSLPVSLQQLLLNVFQSGLLSGKGSKSEPLSRPLSELIQILKTHLYRRDFLSAFADANDELLKAYALRWSAGRALGYAGIFAAVCEMITQDRATALQKKMYVEHIVCIGGGAGAEIVGLAAAWRWLNDQGRILSLDKNMGDLSLGNKMQPDNNSDAGKSDDNRVSDNNDIAPAQRQQFSNLSITAVDIADWSPLIDALRRAVSSDSIPSSKSCPAPLIPQGGPDGRVDDVFQISFKKADVLSLTDEELRSLLAARWNDLNGSLDSSNTSTEQNGTVLVTLMFTLNELFSTSIPKTTAFLLRLTDMLSAGTLLLVVDSPGSYSTLTLGGNKAASTAKSATSKSTNSFQNDSTTRQDSSEERPVDSGDAATQQRKYPMRFLLDHALISVADGKWERVLSDDSRWFRRDTSQLKYQVGDGIGLEDMRFQIHVYRRQKD
ncbi:hypothetical protein AJ79_04809 [Helicocarpus griseus UAMH5409]|uniref:25S rRNA (Uridine(2843)-N(3))-methyltransferase n=1 Tax=Helicocarpus griseus UAMH5409 TaxID=1447875 RepID=A0A2B7XS09_9EURO|nr:hypothetical protein AJ79_04809 [Helicocarpus griseus UAMH5409]